MSGLILKFFIEYFFISYNFAQNFDIVMNQPELGKKIAELRKAKGLTQEELVAICNLNVRTLQRIESGEVTPRSYTIKIIFSALDFNIFDSSYGKYDNVSDSTDTIKQNWLGQIFKYVFDLFNLKINTMKKLLILSALTISLVFFFTSISKAQGASTFNKTEFVGTWQLCNYEGIASSTGTVRYKIITPETFVVVELNKDNNTYQSIFFGSYTLENGTYEETINFTSPALVSFKGLKNSFKLELKKDLLYSKGIGNPYNEIWKRIKK